MNIKRLSSLALALIIVACINSFACKPEGDTFGSIKKFCITSSLGASDSEKMYTLGQNAANAQMCLLKEPITNCFLLLEPGIGYFYEKALFTEPKGFSKAASLLKIGPRYFKFQNPSTTDVTTENDASFSKIQEEIDAQKPSTTKAFTLPNDSYKELP